MLTWLLRRRIAAFERAFDYDMGYAHDILAAGPGALLRFSRIDGMSDYCRDLPAEAWHAAKIVAMLAEDCGSCLQLVVTMAERAGIAVSTLRAIVAGDVAALPPDAALGYSFARATLARDAAADELREAVLARWGRRGLVSLAFAIASARVFPTLKYALGHGHACSRISVGGTDVAVTRHAA